MTIASWIAEQLCPQVFTEQRAYARMKAEAIDAYHWLGAHPDAADALRWLLDNDHNRRRAIGEKAIGVLPSDISGFRNMLDARHNQQQGEIRKLRDIVYHLGDGCAPGNIDLLEMIANEIDCGRDCENGSTEWDTNAFNCRKIDEGTCAGTNAEELRQLASAFRNRMALASMPAWPLDTEDQVEALARECGWNNRRYMTKADYTIFCDRMRKFAQLAARLSVPQHQSTSDTPARNQ
ncbi:hypothetical protein HGO34_15610 [Agrobacterium vitis]|uniref:hypothetical protein n=1 Tax=Agrobacterium vitis TaxID=373 RepID=UPI002034217E|nr:hypothetical protein [Agrobacterium vitis]MCM2441148.1 hypothetical protein [Agrobacterium vitis]